MEANWHRHYFSIADHRVGVFFREGQTNDLALIPSYEPFRTTEEDCVMVMEVDDTLHPVPKDQRSRIRVFDTGNGDTAVDRLEDGGYQFIIKDIRGRACCLLIADKAFAHCRCALNGDGMMRSLRTEQCLDARLRLCHRRAADATHPRLAGAPPRARLRFCRQERHGQEYAGGNVAAVHTGV